MKKLTLALSLAALASAGFATDAFAERYDTRRDVAEIANADRGYHHGDWERRVRSDLDRLNAEVVQLRREIGNLQDDRIRDRFHQVRRETDRLNYAVQARRIRGWEVQRRADEIRSDMARIRRELRARSGGRHWR